MTPYYQDESCTIYHGDCCEILPTLDKVDLVLTDPPYGLGIAKKGAVGSNTTVESKRRNGMKEWGNQEWDSEPADQELIEQCVKISSVAVIWGGNYFDLPPSPCWFIWDKCQRDFTFSDGELAWTNLKTAVRIFSYSRGALTTEGRLHPTCKPATLMTWCISLSKSQGVILDPFMGSGTTLRAAKDLNRISIGIELEEKYCEIAAKRLAQEVFAL